MPDLHRDSDLHVRATVSEGTSNVMLEAMASGLPIVATRCEGVEELIQDNGCVVDTAEALAQAQQDFLANPALLQRMRTAARTRAQSLSWASAAQQYQALYQRLCGGEAS